MSTPFFCLLLLVSAQVDPAAPDEGLESGALPSHGELDGDRSSSRDPDDVDEVDQEDFDLDSKKSQTNGGLDAEETQSNGQRQTERVKRYKNADFVEKYFPYSSNQGLHSSVDVTWHFLGGCCGFMGGQVWMPMLFGGDAPEGYLSEAIVGWLLHQVGLVALYVAFGAITAVLPPVGGVLTAVLTLLALVDVFYFLPVQTQNAWDRRAYIQDARLDSTGDLDALAMPKEQHSMNY